jgi:integrase/recombinase XerD
MPGPKPRLHLPYAQWPATDRLLWQQAFCHDDPFAKVRLAKASQDRCMWSWRRFLGYLTGYEPTALELAPAERLSIERLRPFASHLAKTNAPQSVASIVDALYTAARVMMPDQDWTWLKKVNSRLHTTAPMKSPAGPVITSVQLLDLGLKLMDESTPRPSAPFDIHEAIKFRDGLMAAALAFAPIRPKNLASLEIGRHVVVESDRWFIVIPQEETKTAAPIEFAIPKILIPYLTLYLDIVRSAILRDATCGALWVSPKGGPLSYVGIVKSFHRLSDRLGVRIAPHDARDAAATTWAISAPDQIGVARDLLTHSDLRTTNKHYNRARGIEASRAYSQVIAKMRKTKSALRRRTADS